MGPKRKAERRTWLSYFQPFLSHVVPRAGSEESGMRLSQLLTHGGWMRPMALSALVGPSARSTDKGYMGGWR